MKLVGQWITLLIAFYSMDQASASCRPQKRSIIVQTPMYNFDGSRVILNGRSVAAGVGGVNILGPHPKSRSFCHVRVGSTVGYIAKNAIDYPQSTQAGVCSGGCDTPTRVIQTPLENRQTLQPVVGVRSAGSAGLFRVEYEKAEWYAPKIMANLSKSYAAGQNECAKGVRLALEGAGVLPVGADRSMVMEDGVAQAKHYWKLLAANGWVNDETKCLVPGAVRVYSPGPEARVLVRQGKGTAGDKWGHFEIVGSDGRFHFGARNNVPMDHPSRMGPARRQLTHCMVYRGR